MNQNVPQDHHIVPKFILKNWSDDGSIVHTWKGTYERKREFPISGIFYRKYQYGKTPKIETELFANDIEDKMKHFIDEIRRKKTIINDERPLKFLLSSFLRTSFIVEMCKENIEKMVTYACKDAPNIEQAKKETLKQLNLLDDDGEIIGYDITFYDALWPEISKFRKTTLLKTKKEFVIGENPVVFICPYGNRVNDPLSMIVYPISPKELLVFYRPEEGVVDSNRFISDDETHIFNSYQFQQTNEIIVFHDELQVDFKKFENQFGVIAESQKILKIPIGSVFISLPFIQMFHFYYDEGLKKIINPKNK